MGVRFELQKRPMTLRWSFQRLRWFIVAWITLSTVLNLLCRQGLYLLAPVLQRPGQLNMGDASYAKVVSIFALAYAVMYTGGGRIVDWIGERMGLALFVSWWSVWTALTSLVHGVFGLGAMQFLAALGEPGNYPAGLRAMTHWFSESERGVPIAIFSCGSALGNTLAVPIITWIALAFGTRSLPNWRATFVVMGVLGALWTVVWLSIDQSNRKRTGVVSAPPMSRSTHAEAAPLAKQAPARWRDLLRNRNVQGLVLARLVSDPVWWFVIAFAPKYLASQRHFSLQQTARYLWIPYLVGIAGGILGGYASDALIRRGSQAARARLRVLYISAAFAPLGIFISRVPSAGMAIVLIAAMSLVVYSWFINTAAIIPDVMPKQVVGSVLGLMGTAGSLGGFLFIRLVGFLLTHYSYTLVFLLAGSMHLVASLILWTFMREQPARA